MYSFPAADKLWAEYARIRDESLRNDGDGHEATDFYFAEPRRDGRRCRRRLASAISGLSG